MDMADRALQHLTNNVAAFTLNPGTVRGSSIVDITNGATAGTISFAGWTVAFGRSLLTTNNGNKFRCFCCVGEAGSSIYIVPMQ